MPLNIDTFSNAVGGNAFYKAVTHPLAADPARNLVSRLQSASAVAIYDPGHLLAAFDAVWPLEGVSLAGLFVSDLEQVGRVFRGATARPVTEMQACACDIVLVAGFDLETQAARLKQFLPPKAQTVSFDALRIPADMLSDKGRYLSNLNFATNFAFFRDEDGHHTRLVSVNYWSAYSGKDGGYVWNRLFDLGGKALAEWSAPLPAPNAPMIVDSKEVRARFGLGPFTGQLFMHVVGAAGHDVVKYALDTYGDTDDVLSCTHDSNSWPADRYAGLPAPDAGEEVVFWVQNPHPSEIASGEIGLNLMGSERVVTLNRTIAPFATYALNVSELLPDARWPEQVEIRAGKHLVRPRYEIAKRDGAHTRFRMAHPNVERSDLKPDPKLPGLETMLGKGFILPAPLLPPEQFSSIVLPTPMATNQMHLPVKALVYDSKGQMIAEHSFGNLARDESVSLTVDTLLNGRAPQGGYGHVELVYDFKAGQEADGWLHALFRYVDRKSGHAAETSFGAHVFNTLVTYKNEPQSYKGPPPGLSTRLFLRVGPKPSETLCQLIYPASLPWHAHSDTTLMLMSDGGREVARRALNIPCGGSHLFYARQTFTEAEFSAAGEGAYIVVRDTTCRLFGYHGLMNGASAFSLDHMFGF